jgi:glutathione synthase/RimK-type ligase-like ATP-grasp enzyme
MAFYGQTYLTRNVEEAVSVAKTTGYPVVLKIVSSDIIQATGM